MSRLLGGILIAVGILISGASGLCSATLVISTLSTMREINGSELMFGAIVVAIFGGMPFMMGIAAILAGRSLLRRAREQDARSNPHSADDFR